MGDRPLFSFGVIADVQYADKPDGDAEGRQQRYREAPAKLAAALNDLAARGDLAFVLHLGDIIDGAATEAVSSAELGLIAGLFDGAQARGLPARHVIGNHCLSVPRSELLERLRMREPGYYSATLPGGTWRLVVLDTTEMSRHGRAPPGSAAAQEAEAFRAAHPLEEHPQMRDWNGGITAAQMAWLRAQLAEAEAAGQRVIVASHHALGKGSARATHMAWNAADIEAALLGSPAFALGLAGHDHMGGYAQRAPGQHFITLEALLEAPPGSNAYAVVEVHSRRLVVRGVGSASSRELPLA